MTSCIISFGQNALVIADDASIAELNGDLQPFADLDALENGTVVTKPYATYEPNYWLLDGSFKFAPATNERGGWVSLDMSGGTGNFDFGTPKPELQIDFDDVHSTDGLYFTFSNTGDYADNLRVVFYNAALATIRDDTYFPSGETFFTNQPIVNFKRILIAIHSTNRAQRYARVVRLDFDTLTQFTGEQVKAARVVEQINPLSVELPINTLELDLFSNDGDFSIVEPAGFYANLQYKEPLDVYEELETETIYIGRFYLDKWESKSENEAHFEASDAIGLLETFPFLGGLYASPEINSEDLIDDILTTAGIDYILDAALEGFPIDGFLEPYSTCREALQQVCFYIGAYVTCARSRVIEIRPLELASDLVAWDYELTAAEKGINSPLTLRPLVTGIEIHKFDFFSDNFPTGEELYNASLGTGAHTIILSQSAKMPAGLVLAGTASYSITLNRYTHCNINVTGAGSVILEQNEGVNITDLVEGFYNLALPAGTKENILSIDGAMIITTSALSGQILASEVAERVYDYYQQRYEQNTRLFASLIAPGDSVLVDVQSSKQMSGIVEKMETDLAGGYVSDVEIVGVILP